MSDPHDDLRRYAAFLRDETSEDAARRAVARAVAAPAPRRLRRPAVVAAAALVFGNGALAAVADAAVPGDALYGVDRAYERLGELLGVDHAPERLAEATDLVADGRFEDAAAALDEIPPDRTDLHEAVDELRETVAAEAGTGAGEEISEKAREIGEAAPGRPDDPPAGSPEDTPADPPTHGDGQQPGLPTETPEGPDTPPGPPAEAPGGPPQAPPGQGGGPEVPDR